MLSYLCFKGLDKAIIIIVIIIIVIIIIDTIVIIIVIIVVIIIVIIVIIVIIIGVWRRGLKDWSRVSVQSSSKKLCGLQGDTLTPVSPSSLGVEGLFFQGWRFRVQQDMELLC